MKRLSSSERPLKVTCKNILLRLARLRRDNLPTSLASRLAEKHFIHTTSPSFNLKEACLKVLSRLPRCLPPILLIHFDMFQLVSGTSLNYSVVLPLMVWHSIQSYWYG